MAVAAMLAPMGCSIGGSDEPKPLFRDAASRSQRVDRTPPRIGRSGQWLLPANGGVFPDFSAAASD